MKRVRKSEESPQSLHVGVHVRQMTGSLTHKLLWNWDLKAKGEAHNAKQMRKNRQDWREGIHMATGQKDSESHNTGGYFTPRLKQRMGLKFLSLCLQCGIELLSKCLLSRVLKF